MFNSQMDIIIFSIIISFFFLLGIYDDKKNINPNLKLILLGIMVYLLIISNENLIINEIRLSFFKSKLWSWKFFNRFYNIVFFTFHKCFNMFDGINYRVLVMYFSFLFIF